MFTIAVCLEDMAGNVWEWCSDAIEASLRVYRGGRWASLAEVCRSAYRYVDKPAFRYRYQGFRVAAVPPGPGPGPATGEAEPVA